MRPLLICFGACWALCGSLCLAASTSSTASHLGCEIRLEGSPSPLLSIIDSGEAAETPEARILQYWIEKQKSSAALLTQIGAKLGNPHFDQQAAHRELEHFAYQDDLLKKIFAQTKSPYPLASKVGHFPDGRVLATLLYGLSFSQMGRDLIDRAWPILTQALKTDFHFSVLDEDDEAPFGLCSILDETTDADLKNDLLVIAINRDLPLGEAILILAHELTHGYDFLINKVSKNHRGKAKTVLIEHRAVYMEKAVAHELLQQWPLYRSWYHRHPRNFVRSTLHLTEAQFIEQMKKFYKVDAPTLTSYFKTHAWDAFAFSPH